MSRPTLKTIAAMTGFSVTTVSRALKDGPELSVETKQLVRSVADKVGYHPNRAGVRLRTGRTYVICLIVDQSDDTNEFARSLLLGITSVLSTTRYHLLVLPQHLQQDPLEPVRYILNTGAADGLIMAHTLPQDERAKLLLERNFPFVTLGRTELSTQHPYYDVDNDDFTYRATRYLIERGRTRIMLLRPPHQFTYSGHQLAGYRRALYEAGLTPVQPLGSTTLYSPALEIRKLAKELASGANGPDGYVIGSEGKALAALSGLRSAGAEIGRNVDVVPKETSNLFDFISPPMTGFFEDSTYAGESLGRLLMSRIEDAEPASELQILNRASLRPRSKELVA